MGHKAEETTGNINNESGLETPNECIVQSEVDYNQ